MNRNLAYYISGHGFGHYARSIPVLRQIINEFNVHIKSEVQEYLFTKYFKNKIRHWSQRVDTGCQHSNSLEVDFDETFKEFQNFQERSTIKEEKIWLIENQIALVISDIASMPLKASHDLGIPSILIGNFTWYDIYSHLPGAKKQKYLLQVLKEEYNCADLQILPQCHLPPQLNIKSKEVGFIAQKGRDIRKDIEECLNICFAGKTLVFIYLGQYGTRSLLWENLSQNKEHIYLTCDPIEKSVPGLYILDNQFDFPDLIASVDIVCTKGGYSTIGSAFANNKPVITCERHDFYEFKAISEYLLDSHTGVIISGKEFYQANWQGAIKTALSLTVKDKVPLNGEIEISKTIRQILS